LTNTIIVFTEYKREKTPIFAKDRGGNAMAECNGYAVHGTLRLLQRGDITIAQASEIVNMWIEITAKKFYSEGVLDGLRRNSKSCVQRAHKTHTELCDMGIR
jgi:hypothetical protein